MDIPVIGRDVEIPHADKAFMGLQLRADVVANLAQPEQFMVVFFAADLLPVHHVEIQYAHTIDGCAQDASLWVVKSRYVCLYPGWFMTTDDGDAVIGLLAGIDHVITCILDVLAREVLIGQLGLLQAQYIGRGRRQPIEYLWQADLEGVDVPGGNFH